MSIGQRLREERVRLGLSHTEFAALGSTSKKTQMRYESDQGGGPDCAFLSAIASAGADIQYVLTGVRSVASPGMSATEIDQFNDIVDLFWNLSDEGRQTAKSLLGAIVHQEFEKKGGKRGVKKSGALIVKENK